MTATKNFQAALAKYALYTGVPGFDCYKGWASADLMIKGLELAGTNPTPSGLINVFHGVTNFKPTCGKTLPNSNQLSG